MDFQIRPPFLLHPLRLVVLVIMIFTYHITPWSRVLPEKLTGSQLVKKKSTHFMETEVSLSNLQIPATCPYSGPDHSSPCTLPTFCRSILILSFNLHLDLPVASFPKVSPPKPCMPLSYPPYVLHALPI